MNKKINLDYLYLDLNTCSRCQESHESLEEALKELRYKHKDTEFSLTKIHIDSVDKAVEEKFVSSPTIRVNGREVPIELKESNCTTCGDICGDDIDCRVWVYRDEEYTYAPKNMIVELMDQYINGDIEFEQEIDYELPDNIISFFTALDNKETTQKNEQVTEMGCCSTETSCCNEPTSKTNVNSIVKQAKSKEPGSITIDGQLIEFTSDDINIVDVASRAKITIPAPCYRTNREKGCCHSCVVEIDGNEKYACGVAPIHGMDVIVDRPDLKALRKENILKYNEGAHKKGSCECNKPHLQANKSTLARCDSIADENSEGQQMSTTTNKDVSVSITYCDE